MGQGFFTFLKKDIQLMLSGKFLLVAAGSLLLYSCYINYIYVTLNQEMYSVYVYVKENAKDNIPKEGIRVNSKEALMEVCKDGSSIGLDYSEEKPKVYMVSSGTKRVDSYRSAYGVFFMNGGKGSRAEVIGSFSKESKSRREITAEFLFFEITAVGFLGVASLLFKEKHMGVLTLHGILPMSKGFFLASKVLLFLVTDLLFSVILTVVNVKGMDSIYILPGVLWQTFLLSLFMSLSGFLVALLLKDLKQFSLYYLVFAVFLITPVFLAGQTGIDWKWIKYHPAYPLFCAMKDAYFGSYESNFIYYCTYISIILLLIRAVYVKLGKEMMREA